MQCLQNMYMEFLKLLHIDVTNFTMISYDINILNVLKLFVDCNKLASIFLQYCHPKDSNNGYNYADTLLGSIFTISILPRISDADFNYFQDPLDKVGENFYSFTFRSAVEDLPISTTQTFYFES